MTWNPHADAEWRMERDNALTVPCPECGAMEGNPCLNVHDGEPIEKQPAHWRRIAASTKETA